MPTDQDEMCEEEAVGNRSCSDQYDCCDCGTGECGCQYCWSCRACEVCNPKEE